MRRVLLIAALLVLPACGDDAEGGPSPAEQLEEAQGKCMSLYYLADAWRKAHKRVPESLSEALPKPEDGGVVAAPVDPWGNAFEIHVDDGEMRVRSRGPDGNAGTADDLEFPPA